MICPAAAAAEAARALTPGLVSEAAAGRVAQAAAAAPDFAAGHIIELRPGDLDGQVDLSHAYLALGGGLARLCRVAVGDPLLAPLAGFFAACDEHGAPLVWLENDLDCGPRRPPSVFVAPPDAYGKPDSLAEFASALLPRLGIPPEEVAATSRTLRRLGPGAGVRQIGVMVPRRPRTVRLVLEGLGAPEALAGLGWPGDHDLARRLAQPPFPEARPRLDLDILDKIAPSLGVEWPMTAEAPDRIRRAIEAFAARGLLRPAAAEALAGLASPLRLAPQSGFDGRPELRFNHFKVFLGSGGRVAVKVYLGLVSTPVFAGGAAAAAPVGR